MTLAADPLAPQRDLSVNELRAGVNYGSGVSYLNGVPNPAGMRSGTVTICKTLAQLKTAVTNANYGDDIVIPNGTANAITTDATQITFPILPTITASTPRQSPPPMMTYSSAVGLIISAPVPMAAPPAALAARPAMASVIPQGDPSYVRIMSGQAEQVTVPPPHTTWHVTNYERFAHLIKGSNAAALIGTPDTQTHYEEHHFRLEGLRLVSTPTDAQGFYVNIGSANAQTSNGSLRVPDHFLIDRCYFDADISGAGVVPAGLGCNRGVAGSCDYFGLINSRATGIYSSDSAGYNLEGNVIAMSQGTGPGHIENNALNGSGECVLMNVDTVNGYPYPYLQSDWTFKRNWSFRPLGWRETFHYNAVPPNQTGQATVSLDVNGSVVSLSFPGALSGDSYVPGDLFWTSTSGRPVQITAYPTSSTFRLASNYTENAGGSGLTGVMARGRQFLDGGDAKTVTLSGAGNRTVTGSATSWTATLRPAVLAPPPGCGVFFGINTNLTSSHNSQKFSPIFKQIASVDSDTQLTLAEDYTAGTFSNVYYTASYWDGRARSVMKNLHEWKGSNRVRVIGNVFENAWDTFNGQGANCFAMNIASGAFSYHRDMYIGYNLVINTELLQYIVGYPFNTGPPAGDISLGPQRRCLVEHNLFTDTSNYQWQANTTQVFGNNFFQANLNPVGATNDGVHFSGVNDYQFRHNAIVAASPDYQTYTRSLYFNTAQAEEISNHFAFRDNILHVGDHTALAAGTYPGGLSGGVGTAANADTYDADGNLSGVNPGANAFPFISSDSVIAGNMFLRGSGPTIAAHTVAYGALNGGGLNESSVAFLNYANAANTPRWLTQSVVPSDYALTTVYQTDAAACAVSGSTVTVTSGTIPTTVGLGTPFRILTDPAAVMARVGNRTSATQVSLTAPYTGTTGAGLTGLFSFVGAGTDGTTSTVFISDPAVATVSNISSVSYTESFTHANEASLSGVDQPWTQTLGSSFGITSNAAAIQAAGARQIAVCQTTLRSPDHIAQTTLAVFTNLSNPQGGIVCRADAAGGSMYGFHSVPLNSVVEIFKITGGSTFTSLGTVAPAATVGQVMKFECTGGALRGYVDNVNVLNVSDVSITTGNFAGIVGLRGAGGDAISLDAFSAQTSTPLAVSLVTLAGQQFPLSVTPSTLFQRQFRAQGDAAGAATAVASYDSATQVALTTLYPGTTGAGLTALITGTVPSGVDPGPNTTAVLAAISGIRT